jgi:hypothetical protein
LLRNCFTFLLHACSFTLRVIIGLSMT